MKIVLASNNKGKLREFTRLLEPLKIEVHPQGEFNVPAAEEPYGTFIENCLLKARHAAKITGLPAIADDSGICVNALGGAPGVYSARYAGNAHDSEANMKKVLQEMQNIPERQARFRTVIALILGDKEYLFEGIVNGEILTSKHGQKGFGYDPIFRPEGFQESFAEMPLHEKNGISHRGQAVRELCRFLNNL